MRIQFSIREMLVSAMLIAIGVNLLVLMVRYGTGKDFSPLLVPACWFTAPATIGAGVATLFRRPAVGAMLGLLFSIGTATWFVYELAAHWKMDL